MKIQCPKCGNNKYFSLKRGINSEFWFECLNCGYQIHSLEELKD